MVQLHIQVEERYTVSIFAQKYHSHTPDNHTQHSYQYERQMLIKERGTKPTSYHRPP